MITSEEFEEAMTHIIEAVRITGMPCGVIGDNANNIVYGFVFGTYEMMAAAVDELGIPEAALITILQRKDIEDEDDNDTLH
jgi:hypothetical protein